jgi:hypothetical protein
MPEIGHDKEFPFTSKQLLLSDGEHVYWGEYENEPDIWEGFIDNDGDSFGDIGIDITHWMLMPPPPKD